jgi:hypothetical protein
VCRYCSAISVEGDILSGGPHFAISDIPAVANPPFSRSTASPCRYTMSADVHSTARSHSAMSEPAVTQSHAAESEALFDRDELRQFEEDDREAGANIGKMLSIFFVYTVIVMSFAAYATYAHLMGR